MTNTCKAVRFLHTLESRNDEVLFGGYRLLQRRYFGDPAVTIGNARFLHTLESGNLEATVRNVGPVFLTETPQTDSRFRGNDEYL